jgi:hypothetical protein
LNVELLEYLLIGGVIAYQLYVTIRVVRAAEYTRKQRITQAIVIWFLPLLGAGLCHLVMYTTTDRSRPIDKKYLEDDPLDGLNVRHEGRGDRIIVTQRVSPVETLMAIKNV